MLKENVLQHLTTTERKGWSSETSAVGPLSPIRYLDILKSIAQMSTMNSKSKRGTLIGHQDVWANIKGALGGNGMINGDLGVFLDRLNCGEELLFVFEGKKYFVQGWTKDGTKHMECWLYEEASKPYLWERDSDSMAENAKDFLSAPIWGGKTFVEIEEAVEWVDE